MTDVNDSRASVPDLMVEKLALGELGEQESAHIREQLKHHLDPRLQRIEVDNSDFFALYPTVQFAKIAAKQDEDRVKTKAQRRLRRWWLPSMATVGVAATLVFMLEVGPMVPVESGAEALIIKGETRLILKLQMPEGEVRVLGDGDMVAPGSLIQASYAAEQIGSGVIVSFDGRGTVTQHFPDPETPGAGISALQMRPGNPVPLASAFELDATPDFERFVLVFAPESTVAPLELDLAKVLQAAREAAQGPEATTAPLALSATLTQRSVLLLKR